MDGSSYELPSHPVHEVEVLPVLISFCVRSFFLSGSQVLRYTDDDSCHFALMKGVGETLVARHFIASIMDREYELPTESWYGCVPNYSNPADDPSRGASEDMVARAARWWTFLGASCCLACHPQMGERTGSLDKSPVVCKKVLHHFRMSTCLILIFSADMSALD